MNRFGQIVATVRAISAFAFLLGAVPAAGGTSERVVADRLTGLAISGFDPVAYFTDASAREGREDFELAHAGAVWRFRNIGNRDVFAASPDIYAPQFGGYDPVALARGVAWAGRPQFWIIAGERLYLFGDGASRDAFAAAIDGSRRSALEAWPAVEARLAR